MADPHTIAARYLEIWNEADDAGRRDLIRTAWRVDATYVDPLMKGEGHDGIAAMVEAARIQFPGHRFVLLGTPDGHSDFIRFSWSLIAEGGSVVAGGTDIAKVDQDGRIEQVVGFLDGVEP